jgi:hypothetical protein
VGIVVLAETKVKGQKIRDSAISAINEEESETEGKGKVRQWLNRFLGVKKGGE